MKITTYLYYFGVSFLLLFSACIVLSYAFNYILGQSTYVAANTSCRIAFIISLIVPFWKMRNTALDMH